MNKPVFELNDAELKSVGYELFIQLKQLEKNLDLIELELERRKNSVRMSMTQDQLNDIKKNNVVK